MKVVLKFVLMTAVVAALVGLCSSAFAREKKIAAKDLPIAVSSAFKTAYPSAEIKGAETEVEGGVEYYEIESIDGKTKRDLLYTKDGKVYEIEEVVDAEALPDAVKQAVAKAYPQGKIQKAEKTTHEAKIEYELKVQSGAKKYEVSLNEQGKVLKTTKMKAKKKGKEDKEDKEDKKEDKKEKG